MKTFFVNYICQYYYMFTLKFLANEVMFLLHVSLKTLRLHLYD